jgi:hypothetical protein
VAATITLFVQQTTSHATTLIQNAQSKIPPGVKIDPNSPQVQAALKNILSQAGTQGFQDVFLFVTFGTLAMTLIAFILPGRHAMAQRALHAPEASERRGIVAE